MAKRTFNIALLVTVAGFALSLLDWNPVLAFVVTLAAVVTVMAGIVWAASSFHRRHGNAAPTQTHRTPSHEGRKAGKPYYLPAQPARSEPPLGS
jgi:hypothetical protein